MHIKTILDTGAYKTTLKLHSKTYIYIQYKPQKEYTNVKTMIWRLYIYFLEHTGISAYFITLDITSIISQCYFHLN